MSRRTIPRLLAAAVVLSLAAPTFLATAASPFEAPVGPYTVLSAPGWTGSGSAIAVGPDGSAVASWVDTNYIEWSVMAARFDPAAGWQTPSLLQAPAYSTGRTDVGLDAAGNATVVWAVYNTSNEIWYSQSSPSGGWTPPALLRAISPGYLSDDIRLDVDPGGAAVISWVEGGSPGDAYGAVLGAGPALAVPLKLTNGSFYVNTLVQALTGGGGAVVAWCEWNGYFSNLSYASFAPATGWSAPAVGVGNVSVACGVGEAASDGSGTVHLVMFRETAGVVDVAHTQLPAGGRWSPPASVASVPSRSLLDIRLSAAPDGNLIAAWVEMGLGFPDDTFWANASVFSPGSGWTVPIELVPPSRITAGFAVGAALGGAGLIALGGADAIPDGLEIRQFSNSTNCRGWSERLASEGPDTYAAEVELALRVSGDGLVLWSARNGTSWELRAAPVRALTPTVSFDSPTDGEVLNTQAVAVRGRLSANGTVALNGVPAVVNADGSFSVTTPMAAGANVITASAAFVDPWSGCSDTASIAVTFIDPVAELEASLAAAMANASALSAHVAALEASGDATAGELAAAQLELAEAQAELARIKVKFPWLQENISAMQVALNASALALEDAQRKANQSASATESLSLNFERVSGDLNDTQDRLDALSAELNASRAATAAASSAAARAESVAAGASTAMLVAVVGALLGAAGIALSLRRRGGGGGGGGSAKTNPLYNAETMTETNPMHEHDGRMLDPSSSPKDADSGLKVKEKGNRTK